MVYPNAPANMRGMTIEFTKNCVSFEFGIKININQNGKMPKFIQRNIFSNVK